MAAAATEIDPAELLEREAGERPRVGVAALVAGGVTIVGTVLSVLNAADQPRHSMLSALAAAQEPGAVGDRMSQRLDGFQFAQDHAVVTLLSSLLIGIAVLLAGYALRFLGQATAARVPTTSGYIRHLPLISAILVFAGVVGGAIIGIVQANAVLDLADPTVDAVANKTNDVTAAVIGLPGGLLLALAYVLVSLGAMRAGLLPRAWGIIGIFTGVSFVLGAFAQILQLAFLVVLGLILLGRYPGGTPPSWQQGIAVPWPSAADEARAKRDAREAKSGKVAPPDPEPVEARAAARPHSASKKRKRKKRP